MEIPVTLTFMDDYNEICFKNYVLVTKEDTAELVGVEPPINSTRVKVQLNFDNLPFKIIVAGLAGYKYQLIKTPLKINMPLLEVTKENIKEKTIEKQQLSQEVQELIETKDNYLKDITLDYIKMKSKNGSIFRIKITDAGELEAERVPE